MTEVLDRFRGSLLGGAVGDALGAPFEGRSAVPFMEFMRFAGAAGPLRYTDDTHMTLTLAETLIDSGGVVDPDLLLFAFAAAYEAEPWRGYGPGPPQVFRRHASGMSWRTAASSLHGGRGSLGNGGAMRVSPVALLAHDDPALLVALAKASAEVTHTHPVGWGAAVLQAGAIAAALGSAGDALDPRTVVELARGVASDRHLRKGVERMGRIVEQGGSIPEDLGTGVEADQAVPAAIAAFLRCPDSFPDAIAQAVCLGGDTDTIASMVGALAGARLGVHAIPESWVDRLEGAGRIGLTAERLHDLWKDRAAR
jgi:poly(ADP-ribose) glycohydrolase ARH3